MVGTFRDPLTGSISSATSFGLGSSKDSTWMAPITCQSYVRAK